MNRKEDSTTHSKKAPDSVGSYPHARKAGSLFFLSGVGPRYRGSKNIPGVELDKNGNILTYDIAQQCHAVFQNVKYILEEAGSDWQNSCHKKTPCYQDALLTLIRYKSYPILTLIKADTTSPVCTPSRYLATVRPLSFTNF